MRQAVDLAKRVDDHIQNHMRKLRKQQLAEMEKVRVCVSTVYCAHSIVCMHGAVHWLTPSVTAHLLLTTLLLTDGSQK